MSEQNAISSNILNDWVCSVCSNRNNRQEELCPICHIGNHTRNWHNMGEAEAVSGPRWGAPFWQCPACSYINANMLCNLCHGCGRRDAARNAGGGAFSKKSLKKKYKLLRSNSSKK